MARRLVLELADDDPPAAVVVFPLEGRPLLVTNVHDDAAAARLEAWLESKPQLAILYAGCLAASRGCDVFELGRAWLTTGLTGDELEQWIEEHANDGT